MPFVETPEEYEKRMAALEERRRRNRLDGRQSYYDVSGKGAKGLLAYDIELDPRRFHQTGDDLSYQQMLQQAAAGSVPSAAQNMLGAGLQQSIQQSQAALAGQRGLSPGMAARIQAGTQSTMSSQAANQAAMLRAQEMAQARGMLGEWLGGQQSGRQAYDMAAMQQQAQQEQMRLAQQMARVKNRQNTKSGKFNFRDALSILGSLTNAGAAAYGAKM